MKTYTKLKSIPLNIIIATVAALLIYTLSPNSTIDYYIIWLIMMGVMVLSNFSTYRIDLSNDQIVIHKLFRKEISIDYGKITKIKFEGYTIRGRWLVMSIYNDNTNIASAEIYSIDNKNFFKDIIKFSSSNDCVVDVDKTAERIVIQDFKE